MTDADREYVAARNRLIPEAMKYADHIIKRDAYRDQGAYRRAWDMAYLRRMDELAQMRGLVG